MRTTALGRLTVASLAADGPLRQRGCGAALLWEADRGLMHTSIAWARDHGFDWMDRGVLDGSPRALALYQKLGFVEVGRRVDAFRVDDVSLTDIMMVLPLT